MGVLGGVGVLGARVREAVAPRVGGGHGRGRRLHGLCRNHCRVASVDEDLQGFINFGNSHDRN